MGTKLKVIANNKTVNSELRFIMGGIYLRFLCNRCYLQHHVYVGHGLVTKNINCGYCKNNHSISYN